MINFGVDFTRGSSEDYHGILALVTLVTQASPYHLRSSPGSQTRGVTSGSSQIPKVHQYDSTLTYQVSILCARYFVMSVVRAGND